MAYFNQRLIDCLNGKLSPLETECWPVEEWQRLLETANSHRVLALLFKPLKLHQNIPHEIQQKLFRKYLGVTTDNVQKFHVMTDLASALQRHDIRPILLKGCHLAEIVYGDIGLRPMSDIDILVHPQQLAGAITCLRQNGFCLSDNDAGCLFEAHEIPPSFNHFPTLRHRETNVHLDVHCSLLYQNSPFTLDGAGIFERAQAAVVNGHDVHVLHPEDLLLHLILHGAFLNLFAGGVRALCDIRETSRHYHGAIDWERLQDRAAQWGMLKCFRLTLHFAKTLMRAAIPDDMITPLPYSPLVLKQVETRLFLTESGLDWLPSRYAGLGERVSLPRRLAAIGNTVFPARKYLAVMFNTPADSWRIYACYPQRLIQFAAKVVRIICRRRQSLAATIHHNNESLALKKWLAEK